MKNVLLIRLLLGIICAIIIFHILILSKIIPYTIAWGGRIQNDSEMYVFECISILLNSLFGFIILMKAGYIKYYLKENAVNIILWIFLILFALNTVGNLFATTYIEKSFSVFTFFFSFSIWKLLRNRDDNNTLLSRKNKENI